MAEREKLVSGSPFTGNTSVARVVDVCRARLVASGGSCSVELRDGTGSPPVKLELDASVGAPDEYNPGVGIKLSFDESCEITFTAGAGRLYLYET